jgi:5'-nucleotidase
MKRRDFIKTGLIAGTAIQFPSIWIKNANAAQNRTRITLLQTNDTHSRIDPFPMDGGRNQGKGGIARRAALVKKIRQSNPNTLLVDAGDVFQGTPYFNLYKGKVEYQTMSKCGYDFGTLGNHEFDNGVDSLLDAMQYANFEFVNCNYDFGDTALKSRVKTFSTRQIGRVKVGITGVGIEFTDLVAEPNHVGVSYHEPEKPLQTMVDYMRKQLGCSLVVVLSHLGYQGHGVQPGDIDLAGAVNGIDWIVGGHTHTFMHEPELVTSKNGYTTRVLQVGWAGLILGKSDLIFEGEKLVAVNTENVTIDSDISETVDAQEITA